MTLLNVSLVTKALQKLIETAVTASPAWPTNMLLTVSPLPPDQLAGTGDSALGLYLYHLAEDAHFKNLAPPGSDQPGVRFVSMGLNLFYQLTAHSDQQGATGTLHEQLMLGLAAKALHDYPLVDDATAVVDKNHNPVHILSAVGLSGAENRLRITLQPIPEEHAVRYWTAGSAPLRLSAYYQVAVVLLEPEESQTRTGRVLVYGVYSFPGGAPRLDGSRNTASFQLPGQSTTREIEMRPAQAPPAPPLPTPTPGECRIIFLGSNLGGDRTALLLRNARWSSPLEVDASWNVAVGTDRLEATVQQTAGTEPVLPGIYAALANVITVRTMSNGRIRQLEQLSNETPFVIPPRIDAVASAAGVFTVTGYIFQHAQLDPQAVEVYVGAQRLAAGTGGALNPGEFAVINATTLQLRPPAGLSAGEWVPLRLIINRAESLPRWIEV